MMDEALMQLSRPCSIILVVLCSSLAAVELPTAPDSWDKPKWNTHADLVADPEQSDQRVLRVMTAQPDWFSALTRTLVYPRAIASVTFSGAMRTSGVAGGKEPYECARVQLQFLDAQGDMVGAWPSAMAYGGDTPWTELRQSIQAPSGARGLTVHVGMYLSTGTAWFRNLRVEARDSSGEVVEPVDAQAATTTDTTGWWSLEAGVEDVSRPLVVDLGRLSPGPAGSHGFVGVRQGRLVFTDGSPARFWGSGHVGWDIDPDEASRRASRLRRLGVNMVRLHGLDAFEWRESIFQRDAASSQIDPARLARLDSTIAAMRREGIYIFMDGLTKWRFKPADAVKDWDKLVEGGKPAAMFDARLIELQKAWMAAFFTHVNPHTGIAYKDDPAIALLGLINECSLFDPHVWRNCPASYQDDFRAAFVSWCARQGIPAPPSAPLADLVEAHEPALWRYCAEVQDAYYATMTAHLRSLGVQIPLTGTNWQAHAPEMAGSARLGFIDRHHYWDHPRGGWDPTATFVNQPQVDSMGLVRELARLRVADTPAVVSEWNFPWSNEWIAEGPMTLAACGAFQGFDGLLVFGISGRSPSSRMDGCWEVDDKPHFLAPFVAAGLTYRRGDIAAGPELRIPMDPLSIAPVGGTVTVEQALTRRVGHVFSTAASADVPVNAAVPSALAWTPGILRVDSPRTAAAVGRLGTDPVTAGPLSIASRTPFAQISAVSLDDLPLSESRSILLVAAARAENAGQRYRVFRRGLTSLGSGPIQVEPVDAEVTIIHAGSAPTVHVLDSWGRRSGATLPVTELSPGRWRVSLASGRSHWFEMAFSAPLHAP